MQQIQSTSLANEAFESVVEAITSGEFEPGQKISESELARQLGISRGPVREALQRLEGRLVSRLPRIGVRVIEFGREELRQLFYLREAMEGMTARLAAEHISDDELRDLKALLEQHRANVEDAGKKVYLQKSPDEDFHLAIASASKCENIERLLLNEVYYQLRIQRLRSSTKPGRAEQALEEHYRIFDRIAARDPEGAEQAMREHIRAAYQSTIALV